MKIPRVVAVMIGLVLPLLAAGAQAADGEFRQYPIASGFDDAAGMLADLRLDQLASGFAGAEVTLGAPYKPLRVNRHLSPIDCRGRCQRDRTIRPRPTHVRRISWWRRRAAVGDDGPPWEGTPMRGEELAPNSALRGFSISSRRDTGWSRRRSRSTVGLSNLAVVSIMRRCGRSGAPVGSDKIVPRPFLKPERCECSPC